MPATASAAFVSSSVARRAEVTAAVAEADAQRAKTALYERLRIPNPTFSVFARNDWINERLVGVGVAVPIPIPGGRTYSGEIAQASALTARAETDAERMRRAVRLEVVNAAQVMSIRQRQLDLFEPQQVRKIEDTLRSIAEEIGARRLPLRDALITQQALIDYLFAHVEARRQLCFASVQLARVAGVALEQGVP